MVYLVYPTAADAWASNINNWKPHYKGATMWPVENEEW
jgi:hypothetical protein